MTYQVVVASQDKNVVVRVDATNEQSAKAIAQWVVAHAQHLKPHVAQTVKER